ncbi:MAG: arginase family protein [Candidatus Nitrosotenuis sp.]|nr:MAG: arginase family protein [Candidatus Nitrosotenuis sp.]
MQPKLDDKTKKLAKKISWANTSSFDESDIVIIGIPDETGSHSVWSGTSKAPDRIRRISNERDIYYEKKLQCIALPTKGLQDTRVYDYGNIKKRQIPKTFDKILSSSKIPIAIGGDHSNTTSILKAMAKKHGPVSLVYFDAHPDFVSHTRNYYGSVITDSLDYIDIKSSIQIGIRSPEVEEIANIEKHRLKVITPFDVIEYGMKDISKTVMDTIKENVYVSFDMDCLDPAYAPGVSVPVPIGMESQDTTHLVKKIAQRGIMGLDIMEVCPKHDLNNQTSHLASRMIGEIVSSCKVY